jgi:NTE family protein
MALSSGYDGTGGFRLHVGHRQPWITDTGLEWRNDLEFGNALGIRTELRQPIFERESIFFAPFADIKRNTRNLFSGENRIAEYNFRRFKVGADIGVPLGERSTLGEFKMGVAVNHYRVNPKLGVLQVTDANGVSKTVELPSGTLQQAGINTSVIVDQLSDATFPRHGYEFDSNLFLGVNNSGDNYKEFAINGTWAESIESHSINFKLSAAGLFQSSKEVRGVGPTLGGFQQLSAFQPDQFTGNYMLYGSATYLYRALKFDLAGQSLFVGSSIEIGNVWNKAHEISFASTRKSASLFAGFNSFMGPIYFGFAVGTAGAKSVFFQLGCQ